MTEEKRLPESDFISGKFPPVYSDLFATLSGSPFSFFTDFLHLAATMYLPRRGVAGIICRLTGCYCNT